MTARPAEPSGGTRRAAIGIFGGAFSPVHNGHLRLAIEARDHLGLDQVLLMPTPQPPHREQPVIDLQRRSRWLEMAIADEPRLQVDLREAQRSGPSYTIDTLRELRAEQPQAALCLLLGADSLASLPSWRGGLELPSLAHLVVFPRGQQAVELPSELQGRCRAAGSITALKSESCGSWLALPASPLGIASSAIRELLAAGRSIRGLLPESVLADLSPEDKQAMSQA